MSAQDILKLNPDNTQQQDQLISKIIEEKKFQELHQGLKQLISDQSKHKLAVSFFKQLESQYIEIEEEAMEKIALDLLQMFTTIKNPIFNRAEYKIRAQLADININVKGEFDIGINYLIEADSQADRLGQGLEASEKKELQYEVISNIAYQYFQNDKSEYSRNWVQKLSEIGQYIIEFESSLNTPELKAKHEERLKTLKIQRNNYIYLKGKEEDAKKNFLRAAKLYLALVKELNPNDPNVQSSLIEALDSAIICTVLGEAGPLRTNIVAQLYQDKNIEKSNHKEFLYKTHQKRLISEEDKKNLVEQLKPHQKCEDNTYELQQTQTIYEKAIIEHNILACTQLYETISLKSLSQKLLISENDTELILQSMINKGNLKAKLDQTTDYITFLQESQIAIDFNDRILEFCGKVNDYLEQIEKDQQ